MTDVPTTGIELQHATKSRSHLKHRDIAVCRDFSMKIEIFAFLRPAANVLWFGRHLFFMPLRLKG